MLVELDVRDLGVVAQLRVDLGAGMTALTGETGAGKTLVIEAINLLLGGKADPSRVRPGATEAVVQGRFVDGDDELVLKRVVPRTRRSRAYINGDLAAAGTLAEEGSQRVEIHGQHAQQVLLKPSAQRAVLDRSADISTARYDAARAALAALETQLAALGGDEAARLRELEFLRFQVAEINDAAIAGPDEDELLREREALLGDADRIAEQAAAVGRQLGDGGAGDILASVSAALSATPWTDLAERATELETMSRDLLRDVQDRTGQLGADPTELGRVQARRSVLTALRRKFGPELSDVISFGTTAADQIDELERHGERAAVLQTAIAQARDEVRDAADELAQRRRTAAPELATTLENLLAEVGMAGAGVRFEVAGEAGADVELLVAPNRGMPLAPLASAASGGELSRVMLALHRALSVGPATMIFDEVDAGVGGATANSIGSSLARLAREHQILVVTHLPQIAAAADAQICVRKSDKGALTTTTVTVLDSEERVVELARMLSGTPDSDTARTHARELLDTARR
jgi:DNA repair protein RecN (Recombination protein N)